MVPMLRMAVGFALILALGGALIVCTAVLAESKGAIAATTVVTTVALTGWTVVAGRGARS